jgi:hypothetical protein
MNRLPGAVVGAVLVGILVGPARADEKEAKAILDKGIAAIGGAEKLGKVVAVTWKTKGKLTINDAENSIEIKSTAQGLDKFRSEFQGEFNGNEVKGVTVLDGKKAWRKFGDNVMDLDDDAVANEKRTVYLGLTPALLVPLKSAGFKIDTDGEEKVDGKDASVLKVTGPDGKDFKLSFDKADGLPVKLVATVVGFNGEEYKQDTAFSAYKDFGGIKKATKVSSKRNGEKFLDQEVLEFKVLDKVEPDTFSEPK